MVKLEFEEVFLQLADFHEVGIHIFIRPILIFVDLLNDEHGIVIDHKALDAERYGEAEAMEESFVFGFVIGDMKLDLEDVCSLVGDSKRTPVPPP